MDEFPLLYTRCRGCRKEIVSDYPYCDRCEDERWEYQQQKAEEAREALERDDY